MVATACFPSKFYPPLGSIKKPNQASFQPGKKPVFSTSAQNVHKTCENHRKAGQKLMKPVSFFSA
jgi:hypothetical protein